MIIFEGGVLDFNKDPRLKGKNLGFMVRLKQKPYYSWESPLDRPVVGWNKIFKILMREIATRPEDNLDKFILDIIDMDTGEKIGMVDIKKTQWYRQAKVYGKYKDNAMTERIREWEAENDGGYEAYMDYVENVTNPKYLGRKKKIVKVKPKRKLIKKCKCKK